MKPYLICHMMPSVDGRIVGDRWKITGGYKEYERTGASFKTDGWMCGRVTMEGYAGKASFSGKAVGRNIPREDFIAPHKGKSYAVALDPSGRLNWKSNHIDADHIVEILAEKVSDSYLEFLQKKNISYIFGGKTQIDLKRVLEKLGKYFQIKKLLLEGGGKINGSFLAAGLIDELSLLLMPVADGTIGTASLFDIETPSRKKSVSRLKLLATKKLTSDILWLRYKVQK
ncbi:RibD family protein [Pedosphaera parvula]|uniref:Bifunctional deaminase-reductase domain protein n=1 Tax=Pedosphaera parvula (strain Ellin514) TaxID=320771 RepID=B9XKP8_PEDPL|nr:RibD family protein [Pedosphaera parvula]EEF59541.1 bifunctional deaminase-reductase domain protein [Pedosphaera parvula Ellin514]